MGPPGDGEEMRDMEATRYEPCRRVEIPEGIERIPRDDHGLWWSEHERAATTRQLMGRRLMPAPDQVPIAYWYQSYLFLWYPVWDAREAVPWTGEMVEAQRRSWRDAARTRRERERRERRELEAQRAAVREVMARTGCPDEDTAAWATYPHTAWQWVHAGFVPSDGARFAYIGPAEDYLYCRVADVRWDPDRAESLMPTGPREVDRLPDGRPYDGRPWWR